MLCIVVYLDDGITAAQNFSRCEEQSLLVRSDLIRSGFVPNKGKCQWVPIQIICCLGIFLGKIIVCLFQQKRISCIFHEVTEIMSHRSVSARKLARVIGRIVACFLIIGGVFKLMTKALHRLIECRKSLDSPPMSRNAHDDKNGRFGERAARLTILAKLAILAIFCQFCQISSSIGIDTTRVNIGAGLAILAILTNSAILAMFCQFRQISSSIGIHTTRVNIGDFGDFGDFDKFGNFDDVLPMSSNLFIHWYSHHTGEHWRF